MGRGLLIIVSGLFVVYGIIQNSVTERKHTMTDVNVDYTAKTQAKNIANTMAELSFKQIRNAGPSGGCVGNLTDRSMFKGTGSATVNCKTEGGFTVREISATGEYITGQDDNKTKITTTVTLDAKRNPFSRFSYFTNSETMTVGGRTVQIYFGSGDVLNGPVHTNGQFSINGDPTFNGDISSTEEVSYANGKKTRRNPDGDDPNFNGSKDFNADKIDLPVGGKGDEQVENLVDQAKSGGKQYNGPIKVEFQDNGASGSQGQVEISKGTATQGRCIEWEGPPWNRGDCIKHKTTYSWNSPQSFNLDSFNGIISSNGKVEVKGKVNGNVSLHSAKDIEIMGDIRYKDKPDHGTGSDDYLGLVSEGQTIVDENAHKDHGYKDVDIQASVMALAEERSFTVENYDDRENRGDLNLYGGLIQNARGPVGKIGGRGYSKNYTYDQRFLNNSPRGFPRTGNFGRYAWDTTTEVEQVSN